MDSIAVPALVGTFIGVGLGIESNVSGTVLALYGLLMGAAFGGVAKVLRRGPRRT